MKVVFIKNNNNIFYDKLNIEGYKFIPRRKNINSLLIVDNYLINNILSRKLNREINRVNRAIELMIKSDVTIIDDCDIMLNELNRIVNKIENSYITYFNEFEYFEFIKSIYILNMMISLKKKLLNEGV